MNQFFAFVQRLHLSPDNDETSSTVDLYLSPPLSR